MRRRSRRLLLFLSESSFRRLRVARDSARLKDLDMNPVRTEDISLDSQRPPWHGLRDFAVSTLVVGAVALILGLFASR